MHAYLSLIQGLQRCSLFLKRAILQSLRILKLRVSDLINEVLRAHLLQRAQNLDVGDDCKGQLRDDAQTSHCKLHSTVLPVSCTTCNVGIKQMSA